MRVPSHDARRLAVRVVMSNLAWDPADDDKAARILLDAGVVGVEIAPTKMWPDLQTVPVDEARRYRQRWEAAGLPIVSMQSLLFGRADLVLFGDDDDRQQFVGYLRAVIDLAAELGAGPLVFGSPKNRLRGDLDPATAESRAAEVFAELAEYAGERGPCLCIEPNPPDYGADFVNHAVEGASLARRVGLPGFGLHLDTGSLTLAGDDIPTAITGSVDVLRHFHCSEPQLAPIGRSGRVDHDAAAAALREVGYEGHVSVEMLVPDAEDAMSCVADAARRAVDAYG
jgi:D-psicose/D-tagatose/L-ribulose 3-epimerase